MRIAPSEHTRFAGDGAIAAVERGSGRMHTSAAAHYSGAGETDDRALASIFAAYTVTATAWLLFATGVGILLAYSLAHLISAAVPG